MKEWQVRIKTWWSQREVREQRALKIGGAFLGAFIFYECIWSPYLGHIDEMRHHLLAQQKTLAWMQQADKEIRQLTSPADASASLPDLLQKQVSLAGLTPYLKEIKSADKGAMMMRFQKVSFDLFIPWLTTIMSEYHLKAMQLSAEADNMPGIVNLDILLRI